LIITQTPMNQAQIARLLDQLRETRLTQISVQARHMGNDPLCRRRRGQTDPQKGYLILDDKQMARVTMPDITTLNAPRMVLSMGAGKQSPLRE